jgi:hypothetical protein
MPCCPTQISGRAHCMAARRASLGHLDLATHPGAGMLDRLTRSWVLRLSRLEEVKDVLRTGCRPKSEEMVIRISEGSAAADRHEARVPDLREDHGWHSFACIRPRPRARPGTAPSKACKPGGRSASSSTTGSAQLGALLVALSCGGGSHEPREHVVAAITGVPSPRLALSIPLLAIDGGTVDLSGITLASQAPAGALPAAHDSEYDRPMIGAGLGA